MLLFGVCFVLYFIKLSAGKGFWTNMQFRSQRTAHLKMLISKKNSGTLQRESGLVQEVGTVEIKTW